MNTKPFRTIKSFVQRQRRFTSHQQSLFQHHWKQFGVTLSDHLLDLGLIFGRSASRILEIGFGHGESLWQMAAKNPDQDYLGIEVHQPGIAALMMHLSEHKINNVKIIQGDAVLILQQYLPNSIFSKIQIFFPDPWPKRKHHKRRLIQPAFVALLTQKLIPGGILHCATDWEEYANHMMTVFSDLPNLKLANHQNHDRPMTKFEKRGLCLGHPVRDLIFTHNSKYCDTNN